MRIDSNESWQMPVLDSKLAKSERKSMNYPDTRPSLLLRIRDPRDADAWNEFADIYRPAILRLAKIRGLQNADAEDLAQTVLISTAKAIQNWKPDPNRARFRSWLNRLAQNAIINAIQRAKPDRGSGNTETLSWLHQHAVEISTEQITTELKRQVFRYAAEKIRCEFQEETWQAFWRTAVEGQSVFGDGAATQKTTWLHLYRPQSRDASSEGKSSRTPDNRMGF